MKDALGDRMKGFYEDRYRIYLTRRMPVIIRVDGNCFHTFCKNLNKPFDTLFMRAMQDTCYDLCKNIQGCTGGYVQSDEISLLLIDYDTVDTDAWFDYNLQKICSLAAARATMTFNKCVSKTIEEIKFNIDWCRENAPEDLNTCFNEYTQWDNKQYKAMFDARAFNIPKEEVCNYFIWRQKDAIRNSIQSAGQAYFSHNELEGKSQSDIQEMLFQKGINWNDYSISQKRGSFVRRFLETAKYDDGTVVTRHPWYIDVEMPILTEDRSYIEELI